MRSFALSILFMLVSLSGTAAQQQSRAQMLVADNWLLKHMSSFSRLRAGASLDKIKSQIVKRFEYMDIDGGGISHTDLDGNGLVTRKELSIMLSQRVPRMLRFGGERVPTTLEQRTNLTKKAVDKAMRKDTNDDGAISMQEAIEAKNELQKSRRVSSRYSRGRKMPTPLDRNQDGSVTQSEIEIAIDRVLKRLDVNRDGILNHEEVQLYQQLRRRARKALPL